MNICKNCQAELFADYTPAGCALRCAVCGSLTDAETMAGKVTSHRGAWWSFWLGSLCLFFLVAVFLLLFNDIPKLSLAFCLFMTVAGAVALFLGIRSLLKMRYRSVSRLTKLAAISGSVLGGSIGLVLGGLFSVIGLIILVISVTRESAVGPEACQAIASRFGQFEFPEGCAIKPYSARSTPINIGQLDFRNAAKTSAGSFWMEVNWFPKWITANRKQFVNLAENESFGRFDRKLLFEISRERLKWKVLEKDVSVTRIDWEHRYEFNGNAKTAELVQYYSLIDINETTISITMMHNPKKTGYGDEDIQKIIESLELASSRRSE